MQNPSFEDGWTDVVMPGVNLINQQPLHWELSWVEIGEKLWAGGENDFATGFSESVHKLDWQLPPEERVDGPPNKRLILDGTATYKIFNSGAKFGTQLRQVVTGLKPGTKATIVTNVWCQVPASNDSYAAEYMMQTNGKGGWWQYIADMPYRKWVRREQTREVPEDGRIEIVLRFKCKYEIECDFFVDAFEFEGVFENDPPPPPPPPPVQELPGGARAEYSKSYVLFHKDAPLDWMLETRSVTHKAGFRTTTGGGADDAAVGNYLKDGEITALPNRKVIAVNPGMWGNDPHGSGFGLSGYMATYYPGAEYVEVNAGTATECAQLVLAVLRGITQPQPPDIIDAPIFRQCDPQWKDELCGFGPKTLCQYGCLITAYTMWLQHYGLNGGRDVAQENDYFKLHSGFYSHFLVSMAMSKVYDTVGSEGWLKDSPAMHQKARSYLAAGIPVCAQVDFNPDTPEREDHWVLLVGYDEAAGTYLMNDPWSGDKAGYVSARYGEDIIQCIYYRPETNPTPSEPLVGVHAPADGGDFHAGVIDEIATARPGTVKVLSSHSEKSLVDLRNRLPDARYIVRAFLDFGGRNVSPQQFFDWTVGDVRRSVSALGSVAGIELHNEPNLYAEGLGGAWQSGAEFSSWYLSLLSLYRSEFPGTKFLFPGLSPGDSIPGVRINSLAFLSGAAEAVLDSDDLGVHVYWATQNGWPMSKALSEIDTIHSIFPSMKLWVTEFSNNRPGVTPAQKAQEYLAFGSECARRSYVSGVAAYVVSASGSEWNWVSGSCETWLPVGLGKLIGDR